MTRGQVVLLLLWLSRGDGSSSEVSLNGADWVVSGWGARGEEERTRASVPGDVYSALASAGLIPPPYMADNDVQLRWVARRNWTYSKNFHLKPSEALSSRALLRLQGVDTISTIRLNGHIVYIVFSATLLSEYFWELI